MTMTYPPSAIANYFIQKGLEDGCKDLTPMKLLKLVYMAHGWSLALLDRALISETVQAWKYGPVIESIYYRFREYGSQPVDPSCLLDDLQDNPMPNDKETCDLLDRVWNVYKGNTGIQLSNWTHREEGPWYKAWHKEGGCSRQNHPMSDEKIKEYFASLIKKDD